MIWWSPTCNDLTWEEVTPNNPRNIAILPSRKWLTWKSYSPKLWVIVSILQNERPVQTKVNHIHLIHPRVTLWYKSHVVVIDCWDNEWPWEEGVWVHLKVCQVWKTSSLVILSQMDWTRQSQLGNNPDVYKSGKIMLYLSVKRWDNRDVSTMWIWHAIKIWKNKNKNKNKVLERHFHINKSWG
jgi:hypothetical protein